MGEVIYMNSADIPITGVLEGAMKIELKNVTIVGRMKDGQLYMASSHSKKEMAVYDLEKMKMALVGMIDIA